MTSSPGWIFVAACAALALSALLSSVSSALRSFSRARLEEVIEHAGETRRALRLRAIGANPEAYAAGITLLRMLASTLAALAIVFWVGSIRAQAVPDGVTVLIGVAIATGALWVVSGVIPDGVANHAGERLIAALALPIRAAHSTLYPLVALARVLDEIVRRLAGGTNGAGNEEINAEILSIVSEGQREGHLDETDREMLEAVVEFRSTLAESVMTPRTEIDALVYTDEIDGVKAFLDQHGHSRVPVYEDNLDHIVGILYAKDLLRWLANHDPATDAFELRTILREPTFVPETKTVRELLAELLAEKVHIALIIDEYGGTSGLVTIEDIVEEIFGEIQDEYEDPEDEPGGVTLDEGGAGAIIDARTEIDDANDGLGRLGIEIPESDDYDTVAGFVNSTLGRIPDAGETFEAGVMRVEVLEAEPTRVLRLRVEPIPEQAGAQPETAPDPS